MHKYIIFVADWCAASQATLQTQTAASGDITVINVDHDIETTVKYGIKATPTLIALDEAGNETARKIGACDLSEV